MVDPKHDSKATEYLCLSEDDKRLCVGWNGCQASFLINIENYTVTLGPNNQILVNGAVIGTTDVNSTMTVSPTQARRFAEWILANIPAPRCR